MTASPSIGELIVRSRKVIGTLSTPNPKPTAIAYECIDTRALKAGRLISRCNEIKAGELYPHKTPGGINGLLSKKADIKNSFLHPIDLLFPKGMHTVILTAHTDCAEDNSLYGVRSAEVDKQHQEQKLIDAYVVVSNYSMKHNMNLTIRCYLKHMVNGKVQIEELEIAPHSDDRVNSGEAVKTANA